MSVQQTPPYSSARVANGFIFVSGQLGVGEDGEMAEGLEAQMERVVARLDAILGEHGATLADVVKCQVFLTTMDDWPAMNVLYERLLPRPFPARSAFAVGLKAGALVEIEAIAVVP